MMKYLVFVILVVGFPTFIKSVDQNCNFYQKVSPGLTYYVYNSEYPNRYSGARSCRWYATSDTKLKLSCQLSLPASTNCVRDRLAVSPSGDLTLSDARNYCGTGTFNLTSSGNNMNIVFTSLNGTTGGRFLCTLEATRASSTCECGWKKQTRIVGGTATGVNEYPMMAGIVNLELRQLICGATIISTKHVLSAAHCFYRLTVSQVAVLTGDHDISTGSDTSASTIHLVSRFLAHPLYNSDEQTNDIAIVTVTDTIIFNMEVGPACLPFKYTATSFVGEKVDVLGWGTTEFAGATSNILQKVKLDVTSTATCQESFPKVTNRQLCTLTPGKDACQFDSGGPVLWQNPATARLFSVAIINYGNGCADTTPGVNTRVTAYLDWIVAETPNVQYCIPE